MILRAILVENIWENEVLNQRCLECPPFSKRRRNASSGYGVQGHTKQQIITAKQKLWLMVAVNESAISIHEKKTADGLWQFRSFARELNSVVFHMKVTSVAHTQTHLPFSLNLYLQKTHISGQVIQYKHISMCYPKTSTQIIEILHAC